MKAKRPIVQYLASPTDEARISRMWSAIRSAPERSAAERSAREGSASRAKAALALAGFPLAVAAAAALLWVFWPAPAFPPSAEATFLPPPSFEAADEAETFELADGSRIELDARALLTTITSDEERFVTLLEHGRATFEVRPGGPRRWVVESGLATIEVVGTVFEVERVEERVYVRVQRGVVLVRGERVPDRVVRLTAGESLTVRAEPVASADADLDPPAIDEPPLEPTIAEAPRPVVARARRARAGPEADLREPTTETAGPPPHGRIAPQATVLLPRADVHPREHGDDTQAEALDSFTLGRREMDDLDRPARAQRALRRAIRLGLPERLEQQAQRRLQQLER